MKVIILAGGLGTRLSEETQTKPKPMVEIGGKPIIWHIMKIFSKYNFNEFIICCGYKGFILKEYFANYSLHMSDITFDMKSNSVKVHRTDVEPWKITLVDTGLSTMTGGRLLRIKEYLKNESFIVTYGDGVADIDIDKLVNHHKKMGLKATLTAVKLPSRFGAVDIQKDNIINEFKEKPIGDKSWINGGFFVLEPSVLEKISGDDCTWEKEPLEDLAKEKQISAFKHNGFWHPMDTLRDFNYVNKLWDKESAPWKIW